MPRPSDLFKRTGTGGPPPAPSQPANTFSLSDPAGVPSSGNVGDPDHVTGHRPDRIGQAGSKSGKAQGGAGGSGARPKV